MVDQRIVETLRKYMEALPKAGFHAERVVLFGSFAVGQPHEWSDIDVVVIAPEFDVKRDMAAVERLWIVAGDVDARIEPVACGVREWETDDARPILEIARCEGIEIAA